MLGEYLRVNIQCLVCFHIFNLQLQAVFMSTLKSISRNLSTPVSLIRPALQPGDPRYYIKPAPLADSSIAQLTAASIIHL